MIKAVLFDLDETLSDRSELVVRCIEGQHDRFQKHLHGIDKQHYLKRFQELEEYGYVSKDLVYPKMVEEFGLSDTLVEELFADFRAYYAQCAIVYPNTYETLSLLIEQGYRLGMITNGGANHQMGVIKALNLEPYFKAILISEAEGIRKPDARIFHRAVERLGVTPQEAVMVGDHPNADIQGAQAAGLRAIWKRVAHYSPPEETLMIDCISELPDMLRKV